MFGFAGGAEPAVDDDDDDDEEEFVEDLTRAGLSATTSATRTVSDEEAAAIEAAFRAQQEADDVD